jgi:hypothetical protein
MLATPHDDWDRRRRGLRVEHENGSTSDLVFNPDSIENQIMFWLMDYLAAQGLDETTKACHAFRLWEVRAFLAQHHGRLRSEGLIIDDPDDPYAFLVSEALISVLATVPYEGVRLSGPEREPERTFHADRVIAEAKSRPGWDQL